MSNFDNVTKENIKEHHPYWPEIGDWGDGKTNLLFNFMSHQPDIDKIYLYTRDPYEAKYPLLIDRRESTGLKNLNDFKTSIEYSNEMDDISKNWRIQSK